MEKEFNTMNNYNQSDSLYKLVMCQEFDNDPDKFEENLDAFMKKVKAHYMEVTSFALQNGMKLKKYGSVQLQAVVDDNQSSRTIDQMKKNVTISFIYTIEDGGFLDNAKIVLSDMRGDGDILQLSDGITPEIVKKCVTDYNIGHYVNHMFKCDIYNACRQYFDKFNHDISAQDLCQYIMGEYKYISDMLVWKNRFMDNVLLMPCWKHTTVTIDNGFPALDISLIEQFVNPNDEYHFVIFIYDHDTTIPVRRVCLGNVLTSVDVMKYVKPHINFDEPLYNRVDITAPIHVLYRIQHVLLAAGFPIDCDDVYKIIHQIYKMLTFD